MPPILGASLLLFLATPPGDVVPGARTPLDHQMAALADRQAASAFGDASWHLPLVQAAQRPSWIKRHPVLAGAMIGSVAGAILVGASVDAEASPVGFFGGAAAGALVGWLVGR